jgi:hypothetical protein
MGEKLSRAEIEKNLNNLEKVADKALYLNRLSSGITDYEFDGEAKNYIEKHIEELQNKINSDYIREIHDTYHPGTVITTQTSAVPLGWIIKEAWKKAWPDEKPPQVLTLNVKNISYGSLKKARASFREEVDTMKSKLRETKRGGNVIVVDEVLARPPKEWLTGEYTFDTGDYLPFDTDGLKERKTLYIASAVMKTAVNELGEDVKVGAASPRWMSNPPGATRAVPWTIEASYFDDKEDKLSIKRRGRKFNPEIKRNIGYLKKRGKLLGEIISDERMNEQKNLERRVGGTIAIMGLVGGLFFLSANITGNVVGSSVSLSFNVIGGVLFVVGLVGSFFWFRKGF